MNSNARQEPLPRGQSSNVCFPHRVVTNSRASCPPSFTYTILAAPPSGTRTMRPGLPVKRESLAGAFSILVLLLAASQAGAMRSLWDTGGFSSLDTTLVDDAMSGLTSVYVDTTTGQLYDYNEVTRTAIARSSSPWDPPLFVFGSDLAFAERGQVLPYNGTNILCDARWCLDGIVRIMGDVDARIQIVWSGHDELGRNKTITPDPHPIDTFRGKPLVSGGERAIFQNTVASNCFIKTWIEVRRAGTSTWSRNGEEEYFRCAS